MVTEQQDTIEPIMSMDEIKKWLEQLGEDATAKLSNPGVLKVPRERLKEWLEREDVYITFNGVVLELTPVSSHLTHERASMIVYPDVPMKMNEDKGREEPDPFDPKYLQAMMDADTERSTVTIHTFLALGTKVLWKPDTVPDPDDSAWSDPLEDPAVLGKYTITIEARGTRGRYIQWLKYVAMSDRDYIGIPTAIQILGGGVRADAVQAALTSFPGDEERGTNRVVDARDVDDKRRNRNRARK